MIDISVTGPDDQIDSGWLLGPEGEVQSVVTEVVALEHLVFKLLWVFLIEVLAAADLDLGAICDQL